MLANNTLEVKKMGTILDSITSIHDLVEVVSQLLNNPVTIEASNFDLIAYCKNVQMVDPARQGTILSKRVPANIVNYLTDSGIVETIENSNEALSIPAMDAIGLSQRVVCVIKQEKTVLGHIWVQETNHILTKSEKQFLSLVAFRASELLGMIQKQKELASQSMDLYYTKLIQGFYASEKQARLEGELIGIHKPERFCLIIFQAVEGLIDPKFLATLRFHSLYTSKSTYWFINGAQIFVMIGSPSSIPNSSILLAQELIQNVQKKTDYHFNYLIALSKEYDQLTSLRKCYQEASVVLDLKLELNINIPFKYEDLGFYKLLPIIQQYYKEENYNNEKIKKLQLYDTTNNTDLLVTLMTYLQCNCKVKEAAEVLFVHPNTLNYRLKRISELCSINFEDVNERVILYIDTLIFTHLTEK